MTEPPRRPGAEWYDMKDPKDRSARILPQSQHLGVDSWESHMKCHHVVREERGQPLLPFPKNKVQVKESGSGPSFPGFISPFQHLLAT